MSDFSRSFLRFVAVFIALCYSVLSPSNLFAESQFAEGEKFIEEIVLRDLPISTAMAFANPDRAYLALKVGIVRVVDKGKLLTTPFIDLQAMVNKHTDRGLLGIAVDPDFPKKPFIYLSYVYDPPGALPDSIDPRVIRIARITADASKDYQVALPDSLEVIVGKNSTAENMAPPIPPGDANIPERASCMSGLTMDGKPIEDCIACDATSHTAGTLLFAPNRVLFASLGDGADYSGPTRVGLRTQNLDSLSGRVLRINPDTGMGLPDNPWYQPDRPSSNRSRTWSYGFRNPFRITLKPKSTEVYVGDVGTSYYEEINTGKGANFGWPCYEGGFLDRAQQEGEATASIRQVGYRAHPRTIDFCNQMYEQGQTVVRKPLFNYRHPYDETGKDLGASITGVAFYAGDVYPERYRGALFFADYAQRFIRYLTFDSNGKPTASNFATEVGSNLGAVELFAGPEQNLYAVYIDLKTRTSQVRRFKSLESGNNNPVVKASVGPTSGTAPLVVDVSASRSFDPDGQPLKFLWDFGDGTTSTDADTTHVYGTPGTFQVKITVTETTAPFASSSDSFTVRSGQKAPTARILEPKEGQRYEIGVPIAFKGAADTSEPEKLVLSWNILQIHNEHTHLVSEFEGAQGEFTPREHSDNTAYELCLEASIGEGLTNQSCIKLPPQTVPYVFNSQPSGATISYLDEELDVATPYIASPIVGSEQTIRASTLFAGQSFVGWSDGVLQPVRSFITGKTPATLTAIYQNRAPKVVIAQGGLKNGSRRRSIVLDASVSSDPEGGPVSFAWRFSDGKRYRTPVIRRSFPRDGRYTVWLTVRDSLGGQSSILRTISVSSRKGARLR
ncbi:MAG: PKD domain-containing protein [Pseudomonadota bacterium]